MELTSHKTLDLPCLGFSLEVMVPKRGSNFVSMTVLDEVNANDIMQTQRLHIALFLTACVMA